MNVQDFHIMVQQQLPGMELTDIHLENGRVESASGIVGEFRVYLSNKPVE